MKPSHKILSAAVVGLATLQPVQAVVINSGFGAANAESLASKFSNVVRLAMGFNNVCTGTLISATTILTARHCTRNIDVADITVTIDQNGDGILDATDQTNIVSDKFEAPDAPSHANLTDGTDLAMLTLSGLLPSWATSFQKLFDGDILGALATLVGYGGQGDDQPTPGTAGASRSAAENIVRAGIAGDGDLDAAAGGHLQPAHRSAWPGATP